MSVIGIDFGNEFCYIAVARSGGIETILNEFSSRATPTCVSMGERNRCMGTQAKNQQSSNVKNTVTNVKHLLGRKYRDKVVQQMLPHLPYTLVETPDGKIGCKVRYLNEEETFTPEQITSMVFAKLRDIAEAALKIKVNDCVISVPSFFTDCQRRAVLDSAFVAGLNVLRLLNETTAVALAYGIYKQDLPAPEEAPRNVVFVDMGQSSLQVSACAFHKGKLKMLSCAYDNSVGGFNFDTGMCNEFIEEFKKKYKIDVNSKIKAKLRLLSEVEKLKKQMSANTTSLPISIECFMDDKDVTARMSREEMEGIASKLGILTKVEACLVRCLTECKLKIDDIYAVEIVGGSSRVPCVKSLIEKVYHKTPTTTLNQDEAVARGCALQCAILSPTFRVREFLISDVQLHPIHLIWNADAGDNGTMEVFSHNFPVPFSKILTFYRKSPFTITARYVSSDIPDHKIGDFEIGNIVPSSEGESQKVKVKVRVNLHGIFTVASAQMYEKKDNTVQPTEVMQECVDEASSEGDKKEGEAATCNGDAKPDTTEKATENEASSASDKKEGEATTNGEGKPDTSTTATEKGEEKMETEASTDKPAAPDTDKKSEEKEKSKKSTLRSVELPIVEKLDRLTHTELELLHEKEAKMAAADRQQKEKIDAKNAVEEYVYDYRDKINAELQDYIQPKDKDVFQSLLDKTEEWLYEDGEDCEKSVYTTVLDNLQKHGNPVLERRFNYEELPAAKESLGAALQLTRKAITLYSGGDDKYSHIDKDDMAKVSKALEEKETWFNTQLQLLTGAHKNQDLPVLPRQIYSEKAALESLVNPILNKPKPKVEPPPEVKAEEKAEEKPETTEAPMAGEGEAEAAPSTGGEKLQEQNMEVDS